MVRLLKVVINYEDSSIVPLSISIWIVAVIRSRSDVSAESAYVKAELNYFGGV